MRLIHTADVHLDTCFAASGVTYGSFPGFGNRRRQSLRDVFHAIARRAGEWPADALLIAGDLFEQDRVNRDTIAFLRAQFESIPHVPVFIAPGNHDPFVPSSPYATEPWPENVVIFSTPTWTPHPLNETPLTVHGFGFDGPDISSNPFGALDIPPDERVHVAVAHGSERSHQPADKGAYAPFDGSKAAAEGLAYLALGHFHSVTPIEGDFDTRMYYCGAPEGHGFKETGPRHYLEVQIDPPQAKRATTRASVMVKPVMSSRVVYTVHTVDCSEFDTAQEVVDAIRSLPHATGLPEIARVTLRGTTPPTIQDQIPAIYDVVAGDFEYIDLVDKTESAEDYEELATENTSLGAFIRKMNEEIHDAPDEGRRRLLQRAREVGLAAYRSRELSILGWEGPGT